jgi:hypothetical protein
VRLAVREIAAIEAVLLEHVDAAGFELDARTLLEAGLQAPHDGIECASGRE